MRNEEFRRASAMEALLRSLGLCERAGARTKSALAGSGWDVDVRQDGRGTGGARRANRPQLTHGSLRSRVLT